MDGILNINKPPGITSHDVVDQVRRLLKEKRVGHTGTLDPLATGVLVLCVGKATRIARYLEAGEKEYQAVLRLGVTTDTLDAEGRILETRSYVPPERTQVLRVLQGFIGSIMQRPPAYSAVKVRGIASYKLARQGRAEPLKPRAVTIGSIDLTGYQDPFISINVKCSKGVYIRTLCADIGEALGMGAYLTSLVRTGSGRFRIETAVTLEQLSQLIAQGVDSVFIPVDEALEDIPAITVSDDDSRKIAHGNRIAMAACFSARDEVLVRVHDPAGRFLALARTRDGGIRPELVFL